MGKRYSRVFIESVLGQVLNDKDKTIAEIAREHNIRDTTIHYWLKASSKPTNFTTYKASEQFEVLSEYNSLEKEDQGRYLRDKGLFSTDLKKWEKQIMTSLDVNEKKTPYEKKDKKILEEKIQLLEDELKSKNAVIADLTTLTMLKKKAEMMGVDWYCNEELIEALKKKKGL